MSDNQITAEGLDLLRGDSAIARFMFRDARMRRLVPRLKADGWPIIEVAGKNAARPSSLLAEAAERERRAIQGNMTV
jgi:hypothetical protein